MENPRCVQDRAGKYERKGNEIWGRNFLVTFERDTIYLWYVVSAVQGLWHKVQTYLIITPKDRLISDYDI